MTNQLVVEWQDYDGKGERHEISGFEAALKLFTRLDGAGVPVLMEIHDPDGASLSVGAGRLATVMCFQSSLDPPYFWTLGDPSAEGTEHFAYMGHYSEYGGRQLVSKDRIPVAIREFVEKRTRPSCVNWEEV